MQLIFNNTSGGGNKVKINGLPPNERLNLKEINNAVLYIDNIFPGETCYSLFEEDGIVYISSGKKLFKGNEKGWTQICELEYMTWPKGAIKKDNIIYLIAYYSTYSSSLDAIYKIENNIVTELGRYTDAANSFNSFFIGDEIYSINASNKLIKSVDFGKTWTDITNKVQLKDGLVIADMRIHPQLLNFNFKECKYFIFRNRQMSFDGKVLKKITTKNINVESLPFFMYIDNRNNKDRILVVLREQNSYSTYIYKLLEIKVEEDGSVNASVIKECKTDQEIIGSNFFIDSKNETAYGYIGAINVTKKMFATVYSE